MISFFKKLKNSQLNKGMTYVEIIVVLTIFSTLASITLFNYGEFQAKVDLKNLANDIALKVVEAQKSSLNGRLPPAGVPPIDWKPSYGIYFSTVSSNGADNKNFIYFVDLNQDGIFDGSDCTNECLEKVTITKGNTISGIQAVGGSCPVITNLTVYFKRPDSSAKTGLPCSDFSHVQINILSPKGSTSNIKLYPSGRVQIN